MGWRFLLDENVDPKTAGHLEDERIDVEHVRDALWPGADDRAHVLPYARENDRILVTSDVTDFGGLEPNEHAGLVILHDITASAESTAAGLRSIVAAYRHREEFAGREELDPWM